MSRAAKPGDVHWHADDVPLPGPGTTGGSLLLRVLSIIPFVLLGAISAIATAAWVLVLVLGVGLERGAVWSWASGKPLSVIVSQTGLLLLIGIGCVALVVVSLYAASIGFGSTEPRWFWPVAEASAFLLLAGLIAGRALAPGELAEAGFTDRDWYLAFAVMVYSAVVMRLRRRSAAGRRRRDLREETDAKSRAAAR